MQEDFKTEKLLYTMRQINQNLAECLDQNLKERNISGIQVYFLVYILRHHPEGTYLTELCREIGVSKSTLSTIIKKLRMEGYLYFQENPEDIRKKKVLPTDKLKTEGKEFLQRARQIEKEISDSFDRQEWDQLTRLEEKLQVPFPPCGA